MIENTVGDLLDTNKEKDPMNLDISEIKELSSAMPKDGNIDINNAEILATKYLRGADLCGEQMAIASVYVSNAKDEKQRAYNEAFLVKSADDKRIKTDKMRVSFAELDEEYQAACGTYNRAFAWFKWLEMKSGSFSKMHYMCKTIVKRGYEQEQADSWNRSGVVEEKDNSW